jgi:hypothetical protein
MAEQNYGDRVQARAKEITAMLDCGSEESRGLLTDEYLKMSDPEFKRLLEIIDRTEQKGFVGYDLFLKFRRPNEKPGITNQYDLILINDVDDAFGSKHKDRCQK